MLTTKPIRAVICGAAVLLATACADGHGHSPEQLSEMIADTVLSSAESGGLGLGMPDAVFDPATYMCAPAVDSRRGADWRTEAPRSPVDGDEPVDVGLLADEGTAISSVTVFVVQPSGETATTEADVTPGEWSRLAYPGDFDADGAPAKGVHTVIWADGDSGDPLTCDGFTID